MNAAKFPKQLLAFTSVAAIGLLVYRIVKRVFSHETMGDEAPDFIQKEHGDACLQSLSHHEVPQDEDSEWLTMDEEDVISSDVETDDYSPQPSLGTKKGSKYDKDMLTMALMELLMEEEAGNEHEEGQRDAKRRKNTKFSNIARSRRTSSRKNAASAQDFQLLHDALEMLEMEDGESDSDARVEVLMSDSET